MINFHARFPARRINDDFAREIFYAPMTIFYAGFFRTAIVDETGSAQYIFLHASNDRVNINSARYIFLAKFPERRIFRDFARERSRS